VAFDDRPESIDDGAQDS